MNRRRWWIVWTLFFSTAINYINRQTLSVLAPLISREFHLSHSQLSNIFGAFQFAYAATWLIGGIFLDVVGTRLGLSVAVIWWSLVSIATSFANSALSFGALRFLLGIGEGFNWPGASKAVAEHFPAQERSLAVAIFDSGSSVGGAVAAIAIPWIALEIGWRFAFAFSGLLGLIWLVLWLAVYPRSRRSTSTSAASLNLRNVSSAKDADARPETGKQTRGSLRGALDTAAVLRGFLNNWLPLLKRRETWAVVIGRSLTDPIWWFYVFWLPQYFSDSRGFSLKQIAAFTWIPFVAADLGNFAGGLSSGALVRRGVAVLRARKLICIISCIPMLAGIPAVLIGSPYASLGFICFALFGYASWSTMGLTLPSDLFPSEVVASVTGLTGLSAGLSGTLFTLLVGTLVDRFSYVPAFVVAATAPVLATLSIVFLIRRQSEINASVTPPGSILESV